MRPAFSPASSKRESNAWTASYLAGFTAALDGRYFGGARRARKLGGVRRAKKVGGECYAQQQER